jgi:hypothetical protein
MAFDTSRSSRAEGEGAVGGGNRRVFLKTVAALPVALAAARYASGAAAEGGGQPQPKLPEIRLGPHAISRLVVGSNPFGAGSHLSVFVNHQLREYYTPEQVLKTLGRCEEAGITCWQAGTGNLDLYRRHREAGGRMKFIAIAAGSADEIQALAKGGCIGVAHHGETTDGLFKSGRLDTMQDYLKRVRDAGLAVGVSTHMPDVVDAVESKGWDVDYYMTCVYERHRSAADLEKLLGQAPIPVGEVYLPRDPPRMFKAVRATRRPCLAFKILAAGRLSERPEWVEQAFRQTFESIKPEDGVIIGIYDRYGDQAAEDAAFVRRFASTSRAR